MIVDQFNIVRADVDLTSALSINTWVNNSIQLDQQDGYWQTPYETLHRKRGGTASLTILKYFLASQQRNNTFFVAIRGQTDMQWVVYSDGVTLLDEQDEPVDITPVAFDMAYIFNTKKMFRFDGGSMLFVTTKLQTQIEYKTMDDRFQSQQVIWLNP